MDGHTPDESDTATPPVSSDDSLETPASADLVIPQRDIPDESYDLEWAGLTPEEQLLVELTNRARMDPLAEVDRLDEALASGILSSPVAPLAVTPELSAAARAHSQDMDDRDFFEHTNPDGESPADRAIDAGHGSRYVGENIGWIGSSQDPSDLQARIEAHHEFLWESDSHQSNMLRSDWSEVGSGVDQGSHNGYNGSTFVTTKFGDRGETYLTGVVIDDRDSDDFYDLGEGLGGVRVTAEDGDGTYTTSTWESGGYALALPPGTYRVTFAGGALEDPYDALVRVGEENVKLDVIQDADGIVALASPGTLIAQGADASETLAFLPDVPFMDAPDEPEEAEATESLLL